MHSFLISKQINYGWTGSLKVMEQSCSVEELKQTMAQIYGLIITLNIIKIRYMPRKEDQNVEVIIKKSALANQRRASANLWCE